jgi:DNA primase
MISIDLFQVLEDLGIQKLRDGSKEISGACPMHEQRTGSSDHHPSWSINKRTFLHHCFACGYSGTLTGLHTDVLGYAPEDLEMDLKHQSLMRRWDEARAEPEQVIKPIVQKLTDFHLFNVLRDVPRRFMERRFLKKEALDAYGVRYSKETRQVVMPIRSPDGELLGAQYRQAGSVLTLPEGVPKSTTLFGYSLIESHDQAVLVESPLDAVRLFGLGIPAVASLGAWVSKEQSRLLSLAFSTVYLALDNDQAGRDGAGILAPMLRRGGCAVVPWRYDGLVDQEGAPAKDVGDVPEDDSLLAAWASTRRLGL